MTFLSQYHVWAFQVRPEGQPPFLQDVWPEVVGQLLLREPEPPEGLAMVAGDQGLVQLQELAVPADTQLGLTDNHLLLHRLPSSSISTSSPTCLFTRLESLAWSRQGF